MKQNWMLWAIIIAMIAGIAAGGAIHALCASAAMQQQISNYVSIGSTIFLRLIKMIIAPLVFSTLTVGIGRMTDAASVGRVGGKALLWFICSSLFSLTLGMLLVNFFEPGGGMHRISMSSASGISTSGLNLLDFVNHLVPDSIFRAMSDNEILQIVVFSIIFGCAAAALPEKSKLVLEWVESFSYIILKMTNFIMLMAPIAVFCALTATIGVNGLSIIVSYGKFMGEFYLALFVLWLSLVGVSLIFLGKSAFKLVDLLREPFLVAFSTSTSEAAYPLILERLAEFGVDRKISSFVLPLGYSFNLVGTMMYCSFASIYIAQVYDIPLAWSTQIAMLLTLMLTSKGVAGVPRASLVVIAATLTQFDLPAEGVVLILGVDTFLDMGRSSTNVIGNSLSAALVAKWENQLRPMAGLSKT